MQIDRQHPNAPVSQFVPVMPGGHSQKLSVALSLQYPPLRQNKWIRAFYEHFILLVLILYLFRSWRL